MIENFHSSMLIFINNYGPLTFNYYKISFKIEKNNFIIMKRKYNVSSEAP